ncbi:hypothetical protein [Actimicrobium antarcticum]|uniref:Uncharacterized protein n=1 Tax=Actimicrobium antarcticum TaxID=1051899 RepID=A0ABP7TNW5_9BURK
MGEVTSYSGILRTAVMQSQSADESKKFATLRNAGYKKELQGMSDIDLTLALKDPAVKQEKKAMIAEELLNRRSKTPLAEGALPQDKADEKTINDLLEKQKHGQLTKDDTIKLNDLLAAHYAGASYI